MTRVNVMDTHGHQVVGWFNLEAAKRYAEATETVPCRPPCTFNDVSHLVSVNTGSQWDHQELFYTAAGRWALNRWSQRNSSTPRAEFLTATQARQWLAANNHTEAVQHHFGTAAAESPADPAVAAAVNYERERGKLLGYEHDTEALWRVIIAADALSRAVTPPALKHTRAWLAARRAKFTDKERNRA